MTSNRKSSPIICNLYKRSLHACYVLALVGMFACGNDSETQLQRFLIRGNNALNQKDYKEARRMYEAALEQDSCFLPARNNLGITYHEQKRYGEAVLEYGKALLCDPDNYQALLNRSNSFYEDKEIYRAEDDLNYLIRSHGDSSTLYFRLGLVHARMNLFDKALADFGTAIAMDPENNETWINRGTVFYYENELDSAKRDLRHAIQLDPEEANAYNALSMVAIKEDSLDKALQLVDKALHLEKDEAYFLNNKGFIYLKKGNMEEAGKLIDLSLTRNSANAWAYRNKGRWYYEKGKFEDAIEMYRLALTRDDFIEMIYFYLGQAYAASGKDDLACKTWKTGADKNEPASIQALSEHCDPI